jgi:hypothetical protein
MNRCEIAVAVLSLALAGCAATGQAPAPVEGLRCEYLVDPLGIDAVRPRLGWQLRPGPEGLRQAAYQILVASRPDYLRNNVGDLWDSGRVGSSESTFIPYDGQPLGNCVPRPLVQRRTSGGVSTMPTELRGAENFYFSKGLAGLWNAFRFQTAYKHLAADFPKAWDAPFRSR